MFDWITASDLSDVTHHFLNAQTLWGSFAKTFDAGRHFHSGSVCFTRSNLGKLKLSWITCEPSEGGPSPETEPVPVPVLLCDPGSLWSREYSVVELLCGDLNCSTDKLTGASGFVPHHNVNFILHFSPQETRAQAARQARSDYQDAGHL